MGFGQKLKQWLHSGGEITRVWKWCLVMTILLYPIGLFMIPDLITIWAVLMAFAVVYAFILFVGQAHNARVRSDELERLKVQEEFEAKKGW